ncbi:ras guanine nucleotide exchange factor domain-containing protein [Phycomyces nitens]|nr:ras guanine nucleotide exchange factor domain-containing protein [Phycomyces nitens]
MPITELTPLCTVLALYDFDSTEVGSLNFRKGDCIEVLYKLDSGWWDGWCNNSRGWFPSHYVQVVHIYDESPSNSQTPQDQRDTDCLPPTPRSPTHFPLFDLTPHWTEHEDNRYFCTTPTSDRPLSGIEKSGSESEDDVVYSVNDSIDGSWKKYDDRDSESVLSNSSIRRSFLEDLSMTDSPHTSSERDISSRHPSLTDNPCSTYLQDHSDIVYPTRQTSVTWTSLLTTISLALQDLTLASKSIEPVSLVPRTASIVDAIRFMLFSSNTIDKSSIYISTNPILRVHHRSMMAALSKLVLSSRLHSNIDSSNISRILSDGNELMVAVRNFAITAQSLSIPVGPIDSALIDYSSNQYPLSERMSRMYISGESTRSKYPLQNGVVENIETYCNSIHESINVITTSLAIDHKPTSEPRDSLAVLLFAQFRNFGNQVGQVLGVLDDIDFGDLVSYKETTILAENKQSMVDGLGNLFVYLQKMTQEDKELEIIIQDIQNTVNDMNDIIKTICKCVTKLASWYDQQGPSIPENLAPGEESPIFDRIEGTTNLSRSTSQGSSYEGMKKDRWFMSPIDRTKSSPTPRESHLVKSRPNSQEANPSIQLGSKATPKIQARHSTAKLRKFFGDEAPVAVPRTGTSITDTPWFLRPDYCENEVLFTMEGAIKGGTLKALIVLLTMHNYLDMKFINTFLLTYRSFCTPSELLDRLEARYNMEAPEGLLGKELDTWEQKKLRLVRLRVSNVLKNWLEQYYNEDDAVILDRLLAFTRTTIHHTLSFSAEQLEKLIMKRKNPSTNDGDIKKMTRTFTNPPEPILPRNRKRFRLIDIDTLEMARQMTIMDFKLYNDIKPVECLDKAWSRDQGVAIHIRASIEYCNNVTAYVTDAILTQKDIKKRCNVIKYWVQVADRCRHLNNFNTCMAILSAFDNSAVGRLKRTWEMVGTRTHQILSSIRKLMGANRNFNQYRILIRSSNPPCIPFLGIYLQDLTFIEDGNPTFLKSTKDMINFAKQTMIAEVVQEIRQYQLVPYQFKPVDEIQAFIRASLKNSRDEEQLYEESLRLEPKEREDEKITRLLQESGFL